MKIVCDACSAKYSIADEKVRGKVFKIRCKKCSNIIVVRGSVSESAEAAAPTYQKETKVFDYAGSSGEGANGADDAVWHLVIDQEQVGPMTVEEVRDRFRRGEVDSEGYVWREGFGDWERLADVDVFAALVAGGRASGASAAGSMSDEGGLGNLFGGGGGEAYDDARAAHNDPADLFAAHGAGDDAGLGSDLFAGPGLSGGSSDAADADGLFAGGDGGGMAQVSAGSHKAVTSTLTGQRNENSVLFSLNNLAALASDAPRSSSSSSSSSSSTSMSASSTSSTSMPVTTAGGGGPSEGSGLIDIRSMAQVYLGESKAPSRPVGSGSADDLPVFSQSSFESASPVLLPNVQPTVNNRLLIALVALIGALVIAAAVLVLIVLKGGGDKPKVAAVEEPAAAAGDSAATAAGAAATAPAATAPAGSAPAGAATSPPPDGQNPAGGEPAATPAGGEPAAAGGATAAGAASGGNDGSRSSRAERERKERKERERRSRSEPREKPPEHKPVAVTPPPPDPTASSGCDEVTCLVEPDKPCCRKAGRRSGGGSSSRSEAVDTSLPERPSRGDVASGIGNVKGSVSSCGSRAPGGGKVTVKIKISPAGTVSSASASGGSASLNGCVESAVRRAKFPRSQVGASVNYPFIF